MIERDVERALVGIVKRHGGLALKWVCPGWLGVPDRIVLLPRGRILFVELKRPKGGKISAMQDWWRRKLSGLGFRVLVVKDKPGLQALEKEIGG